MTEFERSFLTRHTPYLPGRLPDVAQKIAEVHAELLLIRPFREGNGRLARWLAELMCLPAGLPIPDYGFTGRRSKRRKETYLAAVTRGYGQDYTALACFFAEVIRRRLEETIP
jgi:cell filamentation protein